MKHQVAVKADIFTRALKDAALYTSREEDNAISCVMLALDVKKKTLSVIACDGRGYYERIVNLIREKGMKPSLPGKPMHLFIPPKEAANIAKAANSHENLYLEADDGTEGRCGYVVKVIPQSGKPIEFVSPIYQELPDYASIRKQAEKGKRSSVNFGKAMFPIKELARAAKVFPVKTGFTVPMYIAQWKKGGLLTLLEYCSEAENLDIKVIFALSLPECA